MREGGREGEQVIYDRSRSCFFLSLSRYSSRFLVGIFPIHPMSKTKQSKSERKFGRSFVDFWFPVVRVGWLAACLPFWLLIKLLLSQEHCGLTEQFTFIDEICVVKKYLSTTVTCKIFGRVLACLLYLLARVSAHPLNTCC